MAAAPFVVFSIRTHRFYYCNARRSKAQEGTRKFNLKISPVRRKIDKNTTKEKIINQIAYSGILITRING
jgi:hypothetical protein